MKTLLRLKGIIVSLLLGIIFLQGIWINNAYNERKLQFSKHLNSAVNHSLRHFCDKKIYLYPNSNTDLDKLIQYELELLGETVDFKTQLLSVSVNKRDIITKYTHLYALRCADNQKYRSLLVQVNSESRYLAQSIFSWISLSALFVLLLSVFTTIYLRNLNNHKQLQLMKDEFISNMTHELKTPISTISVASEILQNEKISIDLEKVKRYSDIIHEENNRLKRLVDRVMEVAIFESGRTQMQMVIGDLHELITNSVKPLKLVTQKRNGDIHLQLEASNYNFPFDKNHLSNIISNLIENAIKYNERQPHISIRTFNLQEKLIIQIEDNGIGISEDDLKHVFEKYYRSKSHHKNQKTGFGLGLFYVYQVVKSHNGHIRVESRLNEGSRFVISFNMK
jgi:signal transduction histidine kinase